MDLWRLLTLFRGKRCESTIPATVKRLQTQCRPLILRPMQTDINFLQKKIEKMLNISSKSIRKVSHILMAEKLEQLEFALHVEIPCSAQFVLKIEIEAVRSFIELLNSLDLHSPNMK